RAGRAPAHDGRRGVSNAPWEGRVYALTRVVRAGGGRQNLDNSRYLLEQLPPAEYLRMSYYERWLVRLVNLLVANGAVTREEVDTGRGAAGSEKATPRLTAAEVPEMVVRRNSARRNVGVKPRFGVGHRVRRRNIHPTGQPRLPRYARGRVGVVVRDHGVFVFPDTNAEFTGEKPQHVYSVRFAARELWGEQASPRHFVHLDMW